MEKQTEAAISQLPYKKKAPHGLVVHTMGGGQEKSHYINSSNDFGGRKVIMQDSSIDTLALARNNEAQSPSLITDQNSPQPKKMSKKFVSIAIDEQQDGGASAC